MKQIKSILLGISLFLLHSCNLLDVDTVSSITGDGYWNTKGGCRKLFDRYLY